MTEQEELLHVSTNAEVELINETQPISLRQLRRTRKREKRIIENFPQVMWTVTAFLIGLFFGFLLRTRNDLFTNDVLMYWKFFGNLAANVLNILVLPLLITKIFTSSVQLSRLIVLKLILSTVGFILVMHVFASVEAIGWSVITYPNPKAEHPKRESKTSPLQSIFFIDSILDFTRNVLPEDFLNATIYMSETVYIQPLDLNESKIPLEDRQFAYMRFDGGPNYIGLLTMVTIFGCLTHVIPQEKIKPLVNLLDVTENLIFDLSKDLAWVSPVITFCLVLNEALMFTVVGPTPLVTDHSILLLVIVSSACLFNIIFMYPLLYYLAVRKNPLKFFANIIQPTLLCFSTSSSMSVLLITFDCVAKRMEIHEQIAIFVLVIGGAIHLTGMVLYGAIALFYLVQVYNIQFDFVDHFFLLFMIPVSAASMTSSQLIMPRIFRMCGLPVEAILDIAPVNSNTVLGRGVLWDIIGTFNSKVIIIKSA
uniref:Amino acid transporter n=1 Tax=Strigamia maritima TaxID=126957 RepID=T1IKA0_STRMM